MDWSLPNREAYIKKNAKAWAKEHLRLPKDTSLTQSNIKHKEGESALQVEVLRGGKKESYLMIVPFGGEAKSPLPQKGFIYNRAERKWDFWFDEESLAPLPQEKPGSLGQKTRFILLSLVVLCGLAAAALGLPLLEEAARGLRAYTWEATEGRWNQGWYSYSFRLPGDDGSGPEYSSKLYDARLETRYGREMDDILGYAHRSEMQGEVLKVYVNPRSPQWSVLRPGISLMTAFLLLPAFGLLSVALTARRLLREAQETGGLPPDFPAPLVYPAVFYLLSAMLGLMAIEAWCYLLRTLPSEWPFLIYGTASAFLFARPHIARWLYGFRLVRRIVYLVLLFGVLPFMAIAVGLLFPFIIALAVFLVGLTLILRPIARVSEMTAAGLALSLLSVPLYTAGMLAPCRALVQLLHAFMPHMPYYIGLMEMQNPRTMAVFDVVVGISAVVASIVVTWSDTVWRLRQKRQVANLATSKAQSAALGLVELKGVARRDPERPLGPGMKATDPLIYYNSRSGNLPYLEPFCLEDETGRVLVDPTGVKLRRGWLTSFGGRICEAVLKKREQKPELTKPHVIALHPGDPVYVIGNAQRRENAGGRIDSAALVVKPLKESLFAGPLWRLINGAMKPPDARDIQHVFFLSDSAEEEAKSHIMGGIWQVWTAAFLWVAMGLAMFHTQLPRTAPGYETWTLHEIVRYAPEGDRVEAIIAHYETHLRRSFESNSFQNDGANSILKNIPRLGPYLMRVNYNLENSLENEGVNTLWGYPFKDPSEKEVRLILRALETDSFDLRRWGAHRLSYAKEYPQLAVPALKRALETGEKDYIRANALWSLGEFGEKALPAADLIIAAFGDREREVRRAVAWTLPKLKGIPSEKVLPLYREMAGMDDPEFRISAAIGLSSLGRDALPAMEEIYALTDDESSYVRANAVKALASFAAAEPAAMAKLSALLSDKEELVRRNALDEILKMKLIDRIPVESFARLIEDKSSANSVWRALYELGPKAALSLPYLLKVLKNNDRNLASQAAETIREIGPAAAEAVPDLIIALGHEDRFVRRYSAQALAAIGPPAAEPAVPELTKLLEDGDEHVRSAAEWAIKKMKDTEERKKALEILSKKEQIIEDLPYLVFLYNDYQDGVRAAALTDTASLGKAASSALAEAAKKMDDSYPHVRARSLYAMRHIASPEELYYYRKDVSGLLKDSDGYVRMNAAEVAGYMGPEAGEEAMRGVIALMKDADPYRRAVAARAAEQIGLLPSETVPVLEGLLKDEKDFVRRDAEEALGKYRKTSGKK